MLAAISHQNSTRWSTNLLLRPSRPSRFSNSTCRSGTTLSLI